MHASARVVGGARMCVERVFVCVCVCVRARVRACMHSTCHPLPLWADISATNSGLIFVCHELWPHRAIPPRQIRAERRWGDPPQTFYVIILDHQL